MFDRLTNDAKLSMNLAREQAQRFRSDFIGPEHMLLGILSVDDCAASSMLEEMGVEVAALRSGFERSSVLGPETSVRAQLPFTADATRAIERSMEEAWALGDTQLDTEHVLLGLIRCADTIAAPALLKVSVTIDAERQILIERRL